MRTIEGLASKRAAAGLIEVVHAPPRLRASHLDDDPPSVKSPCRLYFGTKAQHSNSTSASRANPLAPNAERAGKRSGVKYVA
jgi:hypothetical protein